MPVSAISSSANTVGSMRFVGTSLEAIRFR